MGPAKNRQKNSSLPSGNTSGSVKKYMRVKNSQTEEPGIPKQPQLFRGHLVIKPK